MDINYALALIAFLLVFAGSYGSFLVFFKHKEFSASALKKDYVVFPFVGAFIIAFFISYFFAYADNDFIFPLKKINFFSAFFVVGLFVLASLWIKNNIFFNLGILFVPLICVWFLPAEFLLFQGNVPFVLDRICIALMWGVLAYFWFLFNGINGYFAGYNVFLCLAVVLLGFLGAAPVFYMVFGAALLANHIAFLIFNWYPAKLVYSKKACQIIGLLMGTLLVFACVENLAPCFSIMLSFFVVELILSALKKFLLKDQYADLMTNCIYYQAHISGLAEDAICISMLKTQILFLVLCCFQVFMPTTYTLPIIALGFALWFLHKLQNWDEVDKSPQELREEFKQELKQDYENLKNYSNKD